MVKAEMWIEVSLARHLGTVAAPEELWERIQNPPRRVSVPRRSTQARMSVLVAATAAVVMAAVVFHPRSEFRSDNAAEIRAWVKAKTGLDVRLHAGPSPSVELMGAKVLKGNAAEITYRMGNHDVTVMVSRAGTADSTGVFSWIARGQRYTLACVAPEELKIACLHCHSALD